MRPGEIARRLGVTPRRMRLLKRGDNVHWAVAAEEGRFVLRRFGNSGAVKRDLEAVQWELSLLAELESLGAPVQGARGEPLEIDGAWHALFPFSPGRPMPMTQLPRGGYERLGRLLADFHSYLARAPKTQRPGWGSFIDDALGHSADARRPMLLANLRAADAGLADKVQAAAETTEGRLRDARAADWPRMVIHSDFSGWNLRFQRGRLVGVIDFDLAHLDARAADVAFSRRGYHDKVVDGYLQAASLSGAEIGALDAIWTAIVLYGLWRDLEYQGAAIDLETHAWGARQLGQSRPYRG